MKIQHLAVIFIIIIMPISIVFAQYTQMQIDTVLLEKEYDAKLLNCTYDAIKAYQLNTVNNSTSDVTNSKIADIEASVNAFKSSLVTAFGYSGYDLLVMDEYLPAIVYTLYDGYYIYSPYQNTLTETTVYDKSTYEDRNKINGLKTYVYYSCRYIKGSDDFVITFTLDNSITIQGIINGEYVNESGYLIDGITYNSSEDSYTYDGVTFYKGIGENDATRTYQTEQLKEMIDSTEYEYVKLNGTKYYLSHGADEENGIIYSIINGKMTVQAKSDVDLYTYQSIYYKIKENNAAYQYYKKAYQFTKRVRAVKGSTYSEDGKIVKGWGLSALNANHAVDSSGSSITDFGNYDIFGTEYYGETEEAKKKYIQDDDSNFNQMRRAVIRYSIETNLRTAIASFTNYSSVSTDFAMPKISELDWELIENNVTTISFLQGLSINSKKYNGYAVVPNSLTKEYVAEEAIYMETIDGQYHKITDTDLVTTLTLKINSLGLFKSSGYLNLDYERRYFNDKYYYPRVDSASDPMMGCYSSISGNAGVNYTVDIYKYMRKEILNVDGVNTGKIAELKREYYTALGRERESSFKIYKDELLDAIVTYHIGSNGIIINEDDIPIYDFVKKNSNYTISDKVPRMKLVNEDGEEVEKLFKGWTDNPDNRTEAIYQPEDVITIRKSTILYAVWDVDQYKVSFKSNVPESDTDSEVSGMPSTITGTDADTAVIATGTPIRKSKRSGTENYKFLYWCEDPRGTDDTSKRYYPGDEFENNSGEAFHTLYAIWGELTYATIENLISYWKIDDYSPSTIYYSNNTATITSGSKIKEKGDSIDGKNVTRNRTLGWKSSDLYDYAGKVIVGYDSASLGNFVYINGNNDSIAKVAAYTNGIRATDASKNIEKMTLSFSYNTEYGDSIDAAGILLGVHSKADNNLTSYAVSLNKQNYNWYRASGNSYGGLWKFTDYDLKSSNHYFKTITKTKKDSLNVGETGTITLNIQNWADNQKKVDVTYKNKSTNVSETKTFYMESGYDFNFGFFAETYGHSCSQIGLFKLTNIEIQIVQL